MCAAAGAGLYPDLAAAARAMARPGTLWEPEAGLAAEYRDHYARWQEGSRMLEGFEAANV
jgi:hypothetical protein